MKKRILFFVSCVVVGAMFGVVMAAGADAPATLTIDSNKAKKAVKNFPHKAHVDQLKGDCKKCHHKLEAGKKPKACHTCHTQVKDKDPKTGAPGFKKAFHKRCQGCHKKQKDKPKLKKCKPCHDRK